MLSILFLYLGVGGPYLGPRLEVWGKIVHEPRDYISHASGFKTYEVPVQHHQRKPPHQKHNCSFAKEHQSFIN